MGKSVNSWQAICQNRYLLRKAKQAECPELSPRQARKAVREDLEHRANPTVWERAVEQNSAQ